MTYHRHWTVIERLSSLVSSKQTNCPSRIPSYWMVSSFFITIVFLYYLLLAYWDHKLLIHQSQVKYYCYFLYVHYFHSINKYSSRLLWLSIHVRVYDRRLSFSTGRNTSGRSILNTDLDGRLLRNAIPTEATLFVWRRWIEACWTKATPSSFTLAIWRKTICPNQNGGSHIKISFSSFTNRQRTQISTC